MNEERQKNSTTEPSTAAKKWSRQNEHQKPPMTKAEVRATDKSKQEHSVDPRPRPQPKEQDSASRAQQEQRSTGVSGHSGGT